MSTALHRVGGARTVLSTAAGAVTLLLLRRALLHLLPLPLLPGTSLGVFGPKTQYQLGSHLSVTATSASAIAVNMRTKSTEPRNSAAVSHFIP